MHDVILYNFIDHSSSEVRHVFLAESDFCISAQICAELAGEHSAVRAVHLLGNVFDNEALKLTCRVSLLLLVQMFVFEVFFQSLQTSLIVASH